jgi:hypothetical protein
LGPGKWLKSCSVKHSPNSAILSHTVRIVTLESPLLLPPEK